MLHEFLASNRDELIRRCQSKVRRRDTPPARLAIVKTFIEAHDGAVSVESTEGVGSTFHFTLPPGPPAAAARAP